MSAPGPTLPPGHDLARLARRAERERLARKQAEQLLEAKSLELYQANQRLQDWAVSLEQLVQERTRDLTAALQAAEAATQAKAEFLAVMSHEIRTPLNGMLGMAQLLAELPLSDSAKHYVALLGSSGRDLRLLVDDILDFAKIDAGKLELEARAFDLRVELGQALLPQRQQAEAKGLGFFLRFAPELPATVVGDSARLRQVLINLVGNAIKFTTQGMISVAIEANCLEDRVRLQVRVSDTGVGIPAERMDRLFKRFSQADSSTTRRFGGTGLGLVICDRIVRAMQGEIRVRSVPGQGSEFAFQVQLGRAVAAEPRALPTSELTDVVGLPGLRVLLAEDHPVNALLVQRLLTRDGHRVDWVEDGESAVHRAGQGHYDVILMDMQMPGLDGLEATRRIRCQPAPPPIIALTANAYESDRQRCHAAGMTGFVAKPIEAEKLRAALRQAVQR